MFRPTIHAVGVNDPDDLCWSDSNTDNLTKIGQSLFDGRMV